MNQSFVILVETPVTYAWSTHTARDTFIELRFKKLLLLEHLGESVHLVLWV